MYISAPPPPCKYLPLSDIRRQEEETGPWVACVAVDTGPAAWCRVSGAAQSTLVTRGGGSWHRAAPGHLPGLTSDHPQASERENPFSAASHLIICDTSTPSRMDGLLAARVVSMICLGLVTWIVGEDIMYTRACVLSVLYVIFGKTRPEVFSELNFSKSFDANCSLSVACPWPI